MSKTTFGQSIRNINVHLKVGKTLPYLGTAGQGISVDPSQKGIMELGHFHLADYKKLYQEDILINSDLGEVTVYVDQHPGAEPDYIKRLANQVGSEIFALSRKITFVNDLKWW